jgi:hypothetical protein
MFGLGALSFAAPWALAALISLPVIWWLLRINPPAPRRIVFPAVRLLLGLPRTEETPVHTPLWLLLLRLLIAALVILAVAHPLLNAGDTVEGDGALVLVIDDGWAAAPNWAQRIGLAESRIEQAGRDGRSVLIATTAPTASGPVAGAGPDGQKNFTVNGLVPAGDALALLRALEPKPWPVDRAGFIDAFEQAIPELDEAELVWLSDGLFDQDPSATSGFAERLRALGPLTVHVEAPAERAKVLLPPVAGASALTLRVARPAAAPEETVLVRATAADGRVLARQPVSFDAEALVAEQVLELPSELRNDIARLDIEGEASAAGTALLDERWRRRPVGLISGGAAETSQPLLSDLYYLERALSPFAEVRQDSIEELLGGDLSVLVLADVGNLTGEELRGINAWIQAGGVLVRFAGPRLAEGVDELVPVPLRVGGGRSLGGALSWQQPMALSPFPEGSPFAGLDIPDDVLIERQVLAEPSLDLVDKAWARLGDGTPLVTAEQRDGGWLVLFHTTANTDWASLALSGLFVDMLHRIVGLSVGVSDTESTERLPALSGIDGFGRLGDPSPFAAPIAGAEWNDVRAGPRHPPGEYGNRLQRRALNLGAESLPVAAFEPLPGVAAVRDYGGDRVRDLRPWLLIGAFLLALADTVIALAMRGLVPLPVRAGAAVLAVALIAGTGSEPGRAQGWSDEEVAELTQMTRFAYVRTGDGEVDKISAEGLTGLSLVLRTRTAVEAGEPIAVDPENDELAFYPLVYWPVTDNQGALSDKGRARIDDYLRNGGMILFDTRDQSPVDRLNGAGRGGGRLNMLLSGLNVPPLLPVPQDHALTRSFYLLDHFPGRWDGGDIWVERYEGDVNDGVSSIIIGGNDYAAAWALDDQGYPRYPVVPGTNRQREMAFRFGVNLVMYALTGNYKADQVHIPAILRRLGRPDPVVTE